MKTLALVTLIASMATVGPPAKQSRVDEPKPIRVAMTCFKTGEMQQNMSKICFYDCLGSPAAITIGATQLCPLSINR